MTTARFLRVAAICAVTCFGGPEALRAEPLDVFITNTVENHARLLSSEAQVDAAQERSIEALGNWYPTLDITANIERYRLERTNTNSVITPAQELTATLTQLLWDFGATNATIERSRLEHAQAEIGLVQTRQALISEALAAYINLIRSAEVVMFAQRSEENIRRQTGLEEARIEAGSGLSTDLLQAKTQLAGAQARRVDAEGAFEIAKNRYRAVFGDVPGDLDALSGVDLNRASLPETLDHALDLALEGNPDIRLTAIDVSLATQDRIGTVADNFAPIFNLVGTETMTKNDGGTIGRRLEQSIKLEMSFAFNLGFTSINTLRAADQDVVSADRTLADLRLQVEERVRNAWTQLETAQLRAGYLFDQAGIARAFLEVAIQERQLGQRSLIDVLSGETSLINAQSDAIAAEAEVLLAIVELLSATGALEYTDILTVPRTDRSEMLEPISGLFGSYPDPAMELLDPNAELGQELDPSILFSDDDGTGIFSPPPELAPLADPPESLLTPESPIVEQAVPDPTPPAEDEVILDPNAVLDPAPLDGEPTAPTDVPDAPSQEESLLDSLEAPPSFEVEVDETPVQSTAPPVQAPEVVVPEVTPEVTPVAPPELPPVPESALPRPEPPPAEPPRSELTPGEIVTTEPDPVPSPNQDESVGGRGEENGDLDNPLFQWAQ